MRRLVPMVIAMTLGLMWGCSSLDDAANESVSSPPTRATGTWFGELPDGTALELQIGENGEVVWNGRKAFSDPAGDETLTITLANGHSASFFYRLEGENLILELQGQEVKLENR